MAIKKNGVGEDRSDVLRQLPLACTDERAAVEFIEKLRWKGDAACPRCGDLDVRQMLDREGNRNARFLWKCNGCKKQFTVRIGTIFEDSRIPLRIWCHAFWRACSSKKGVSALQIKRETGLSYKSALFMMHRIRYAMTGNMESPRKLVGTVEADETYVGGKPRYKGKMSGPNKSRFGRATKKIPVFAVVERGGEVRASVIPKITKQNLGDGLRRFVDFQRSRLMTDEEQSYKLVGPEFAGGHESVKHSAREYVRGEVHSNSIESFFALIKRGMYGNFHAVSPKHLHRYVGEFQFRYNYRKVDDGERVAAALGQIENCRLTYENYVGR